VLVIAVVGIVVAAIPSGCWNGRNITVTLTTGIVAVADVAVIVHTLRLGRIGHIHHLLVTTGFG